MQEAIQALQQIAKQLAEINRLLAIIAENTGRIPAD